MKAIRIPRANRDRAMAYKGYKKSLLRDSYGKGKYVYHKRHKADGWLVTLFDSQGKMKKDMP